VLLAKTSLGLTIILQPDNLARMKQGDPVTIPDFGITVCFEQLPEAQLIEKLKADPVPYLTRGWTEHPDDFKKPQLVKP
jgi:hypothetical protein